MYTVYGIPNCDTVKKTQQWLNKHKIAFTLHNYKQEGISAKQLKSWCQQVGWELLLNKKSTTWRELAPGVQSTITTEAMAIALMQEKNSIIKRPVIEKEGKVVLVGFNEKLYAEKLG